MEEMDPKVKTRLKLATFLGFQECFGLGWSVFWVGVCLLGTSGLGWSVFWGWVC